MILLRKNMVLNSWKSKMEMILYISSISNSEKETQKSVDFILLMTNSEQLNH